MLRALVKDRKLHVRLDFLPDSREFISVFYLDWLIIRDFYIHLWNKTISMEDIRKDQFAEIVTMIQHTRNELVRLANASLIDL